MSFMTGHTSAGMRVSLLVMGTIDTVKILLYEGMPACDSVHVRG